MKLNLTVKIYFILIFTTTAFFFCYSQEKLNNQSILDLIELGFDSELIITKIESSIVEFDTSLKALKQLKSKGVPSDVLTLMMQKSKVVVNSGIFYLENGKHKKILPAVFSGTGSKSGLAALTAGIASAKSKSYLPNFSSTNKLNGGFQVFFFQFGKNNPEDLNSRDWWFNTASSPNEFVLIKLKRNKSKNNRELTVGKVNATGSHSGISSKGAIPIEIKDVGSGKFEVTPRKPLEYGEYCFVYQGTIPNEYTNSTNYVFDFSIQ